jgi:aconitate hydratase
MPSAHPFAQTRKTFVSSGKTHSYYSLPELGNLLSLDLSRLPVSIRIVLESVLRNCDGMAVEAKDVRTLATWNAKNPVAEEIPFKVARIVLQDFTGVPLLVDLAAMRTAVAKLGKNPKMIEPLVPVDLVVDHSVQVDVAGTPFAFERNLAIEFERNRERYEFLKWGMQAFETFKVVPPGIGIVHQVNLEYLAKGVLQQDGVVYPDTLVGTDSHTTMINGLGIVGWGVGGIEAESGMLGQPVYFLTPEVVGVHVTGALPEGATATDLALRVTQMLREAKVVGKFVEFYGPGAAALPVVDRATIANMAPEYGATMGFFPIDGESSTYLRATGRSEEAVALFEDYYKAQGIFGIPQKGDIEYSVDLELDLNTIEPAVAGPKRPQDRITLNQLGGRFTELLGAPVSKGGFGVLPENLGRTVEVDGTELSPQHLAGGSQEPAEPAKSARQDTSITTEQEMATNHPTGTLEAAIVDRFSGRHKVGHGSVLIAAITSCTNTSNPSVMLAAGLLAKKAVERGLKVSPTVKASLGPGSRVVTDYLNATGLQPYLDLLGFNLVGYGCTTCIGNSGPLHPAIENAIASGDLVAASVLSGNRNFEARVHQSIKSNFLMSPPLVVAFALAGHVNLDMSNDPLGTDKNGVPVYLRELWPTLQEIRDLMQEALKPEVFKRLYTDFEKQNPAWNEIPASTGNLFKWDRKSTYIQEPPFFEGFSMKAGTIKEILHAKPMGIFGDSVTTDHISPAGSIKKDTPAGKFLLENGVEQTDFNSYGSRRGNDRIMTRGTFANVRIKNLMCPGTEGGVTLNPLTGQQEYIYDAAMAAKEAGIPLIVFGGKEYGTGSSRDWAAKGTNLLGVKAVISESFERIHRSNLVGMGVLPMCFKDGTTAATLNLNGTESFSILGLDENVKPRQDLTLEITRLDGGKQYVPVTCRIDTAIEVEYYRHGGILPFVLRQLITANNKPPISSKAKTKAVPAKSKKAPAKKTASPAQKKTASRKKAPRKPAAKSGKKTKKALIKTKAAPRPKLKKKNPKAAASPKAKRVAKKKSSPRKAKKSPPSSRKKQKKKR